MKYLMDKASVADYLDISPGTVDAWQKAGRLPEGLMMGGKLMWRRSDVENSIDIAFGAQSAKADIIERVRHAARKAHG